MYEQLNVDNGAEAETVLKPLLLYISRAGRNKMMDPGSCCTVQVACRHVCPTWPDIWPARGFLKRFFEMQTRLCIDYNDLEESKTFAPALYT